MSTAQLLAVSTPPHRRRLLAQPACTPSRWALVHHHVRQQGAEGSFEDLTAFQRGISGEEAFTEALGPDASERLDGELRDDIGKRDSSTCVSNSTIRRLRQPRHRRNDIHARSGGVSWRLVGRINGRTEDARAMPARGHHADRRPRGALRRWACSNFCAPTTSTPHCCSGVGGGVAPGMGVCSGGDGRARPVAPLSDGADEEAPSAKARTALARASLELENVSNNCDPRRGGQWRRPPTWGTCPLM